VAPGLDAVFVVAHTYVLHEGIATDHRCRRSIAP
jgi:hypothetical protein